jgi:hypothetical protein
MDKQKTPITLGCHVVLNLLDRSGEKDRLEINIVPDEEADFAGGFLGVGTPLAQAILGEQAGNTIPYLKDELFAIEILSVDPSVVIPPEDAQEKRQSSLEKIIREVEHTNAVIFASSFSGKWGDYDPDSLPAIDQPEQTKPNG